MNATSIKHGVYGGLAGGVVFGALMAMMGMLPMIGNMVGVPSAWTGLFVHMIISATIGGTYAALSTVGGYRGGVGSWTRIRLHVVDLGTPHTDAFLDGHGIGRQLERHRCRGRPCRVSWAT